MLPFTWVLTDCTIAAVLVIVIACTLVLFE